MPSTPPQIQALVEQLQKSWNAADGEGFSRAFWPDAGFTVWDGWHFTGREAIAKDHEWAFTEGPRKGTTATFTVTDLRMLGDDAAAVGHLVAVIKGIDREGAATRHVAVPQAVFEKRGGEWAIASFVNLIYQPVPPAHHPDNRSVAQPGPEG